MRNSPALETMLLASLVEQDVCPVVGSSSIAYCALDPGIETKFFVPTWPSEGLFASTHCAQ